MFVPLARISHVSLGRRTIRLVGDIELGRHAPEALEIVVAPGLLAEYVHDKTAEIEQRPFGGAMTLAMFGRAAEILIELRLDFRADGLHLRGAVARADHKKIGEGACCREVEYGDARSFLFLCGFGSGAVGDDEIEKAEQHFVFLPHGDVQEGVGADDEKEAIAVADAAEVAHGVHGIVELRAAEILTGLGKRGNEVRMLGACKGDHGKPVRKRSEVRLQLVRGTARGDEVELVEIKTPVSGTSNGKMAVVDGIEGTAKNRDAPRMTFCGGSVRLP